MIISLLNYDILESETDLAPISLFPAGFSFKLRLLYFSMLQGSNVQL